VPEVNDRPTAALFDIDGTLVDSNYLHVDAWSRAFEACGLTVAAWRIHRAIGRDSTQLLEHLLGPESSEFGERAKELHSRFYGEYADRLRPLEGATDFVRSLAASGVRIVLATSAPADELKLLLPVLALDDVLYAVTSSEDVDTAKPEPGVIDVALKKAGADPGAAVMFGDTVWDMLAATRAGVRGVGVRSGGISERELRQAGAITVAESLSELPADFDR
jgi:HAD superfamily hydrolase (TIGR01509 family)